MKKILLLLSDPKKKISSLSEEKINFILEEIKEEKEKKENLKKILLYL